MKKTNCDISDILKAVAASKFQDTFFFPLNLTFVGSGLSTPMMICV